MSQDEKMKLKYVPTAGVLKTLDVAQQMAIQTTDGLTNVVAGLGGGSDKRTHNQWSMKNDPFNNFAELEVMYRSSWLAKQIVDVPANDSTREWRQFKGDHAEKIHAEEKRLKIKNKFNDLVKNARLYGGGLMLMLTGQDLSKPLNVNAIKKGDLKKVLVFDRWYLSGVAINITNPLADDFLESEYYFLAGSGLAIHRTHLIRMNGSFLPMRLNQFEQGFGDSVLRKCMQDISDVSSTNANIANLVFTANVDTIKRKGLFNSLATGEDQKVINRYSKLNLLKSTINLTLLDEDETYERNQLNFSGLPQIQQMQQQWISGAADIPMTRLFGSSPGGLNATGESDMNNYHDSLKGEQESDHREALEQLDQVMIRSAGVEFNDEIEFEFNPLYQDSSTETATQRLADAQTDQIYLERGVVTEAQVAKRLQASGDYAIEDADITELENLEDEENEALRMENEELRNKNAANDDLLAEQTERADKAVADARDTIIMVRKNFDAQSSKAKEESDRLISDAMAKIDQVKSDYENKLANVTAEHHAMMDAKIAEITSKAETESNDKQAVFDKAIEELKAEHEKQCSVIQDEADAKIAVIESEHNTSVELLNQQVADAKLKADADIKAAEEQRDQMVEEAKASAQKTIDEAIEQNVVDIDLVKSGINHQLSELVASFDTELEKVKAESEQRVSDVKSECEKKIIDSETAANDRINQQVADMEKMINDSQIENESLLTAIRAEAYKIVEDARKEAAEKNQDDEVNKDGDQPNGEVDDTDPAKPNAPEGDGETPEETENTEAE